MTHAEQIIEAVTWLVKEDKNAIFTRDEIRIQAKISREDWNASYSPTFQAMRSDHPGGAPPIGAKHKNVFKRISHGKYILAEYGVNLSRRKIVNNSILWAFLLLPVCLMAQEKPPTYDPTSAYARRTMQGFTVYVNPKAQAHPMETMEALTLLDSKLAEIGRMVPKDRLKVLRKVAFWVEWEAKPNGAAEYHNNREWLQENGYNPDKYRGIEINNVRNFVAWQRDNQPLMVLHELAHSYHQNALGWENAAVANAYDSAMKAKLYGVVPYRVHGAKTTREAYAATNKMEYFAELTEAYFGQNDFYPFDGTDLKEYDPTGYALMETAWGRPRSRYTPPKTAEGKGNERHGNPNLHL